jgi:hypothetical protein
MSEIVQFPGAVPQSPSDHSIANVEDRRATAYFDMEPHINDVVCMGKIAAQLMGDPDRNLYDFAVAHLSDMLKEFKARYYAENFEP